jgi:hypothetical protein
VEDIEWVRRLRISEASRKIDMRWRGMAWVGRIMLHATEPSDFLKDVFLRYIITILCLRVILIPVYVIF